MGIQTPNGFSLDNSGKHVVVDPGSIDGQYVTSSDLLSTGSRPWRTIAIRRLLAGDLTAFD